MNAYRAFSGSRAKSDRTAEFDFDHENQIRQCRFLVLTESVRGLWRWNNLFTLNGFAVRVKNSGHGSILPFLQFILE